MLLQELPSPFSNAFQEHLYVIKNVLSVISNIILYNDTSSSYNYVFRRDG